jgi:hypothetical protein
LSFIKDIVWLFIYGGNWFDSTKKGFDEGIDKNLTKFIVVMAWFLLFVKVNS